MLVDLDKPEVRELTAQTDTLYAVAANYAVKTAEEYTTAGRDLQGIKAAQKRLEELRKSMTRPIDAAKKAIMDFFRGPEDKLARAESGIKRAMIAYSDEQDRIRREEQRKADEAARREQEKIAERARKAAEAGKAEKAAELEQRAATVVAPVIHREAPRIAGVNTREVPKFEIENEMLIPREYLMPDEKKIRQVVAALKFGANIPGVRVWMEKQLAAGAG